MSSVTVILMIMNCKKKFTITFTLNVLIFFSYANLIHASACSVLIFHFYSSLQNPLICLHHFYMQSINSIDKHLFNIMVNFSGTIVFLLENNSPL